MSRKILIIFITVILIAASGCSTKEKEIDIPNKPGILYDNNDAGLRVYQTPDWYLEREVVIEQLNVTFSDGKAKAIITVISSEKSIDEIKQELILGAGEVTVIEESDGYVAFESESTESIRTDVYISQTESSTGIVAFMAPSEDYEEVQESIGAFKDNIEFR